MNSHDPSLKERGDQELKVRQTVGGEKGFSPPSAALRALFENAPVGIFMSTIEGKMLSMNASGAGMFGYESPKEFVEETTDTPKQLFVFPEQRAELVRRALASEEFVRAEVSYRRKDDSVFIAHLYMRAVRDADGKPTFMEGFVEDITERKRVETALQQSEVKFRTLVERAPLPIAIARSGIVIYVNPKYVEMFRCKSAESQVGRPVIEYWAPENRAMIAELSRRRARIC